MQVIGHPITREFNATTVDKKKYIPESIDNYLKIRREQPLVDERNAVVRGIQACHFLVALFIHGWRLVEHVHLHVKLDPVNAARVYPLGRPAQVPGGTVDQQGPVRGPHPAGTGADLGRARVTRAGLPAHQQARERLGLELEYLRSSGKRGCLGFVFNVML